MLITGCDYHPGSQQTAMVDTETGELHRLQRKDNVFSLYGPVRPPNGHRLCRRSTNTWEVRASCIV